MAANADGIVIRWTVIGDCNVGDVKNRLHLTHFESVLTGFYEFTPLYAHIASQ
jgi:hypothetical protein